MTRLPTDAQRQGWMAQWRNAAVVLEQIRHAEFRCADLRGVAASLEDGCLASLRTHPPQPTSGLVAQQRAFHPELQRRFRR